jgi:CheY-like chemotaxis protein
MPPEPPAVRLDGVRVLLVEDHDDSRLVLEQCLMVNGATVTGERPVDVVITDYAMPEHTGLWLLERILERPEPVPVIVLTGYMDTDVARLRRSPFARVLRKPIDTEGLCEAVTATLREVRRRQ